MRSEYMSRRKTGPRFLVLVEPQRSPRPLVPCRVGILGIEPGSHAPEACILPLYYIPTLDGTPKRVYCHCTTPRHCLLSSLVHYRTSSSRATGSPLRAGEYLFHQVQDRYSLRLPDASKAVCLLSPPSALLQSGYWELNPASHAPHARMLPIHYSPSLLSFSSIRIGHKTPACPY